MKIDTARTVRILKFIPLLFAALAISVTIHEFGHYLAFTSLGIHVSEMKIGFGPNLIETTLPGELAFSLNLIPFAGFTVGSGLEVANLQLFGSLADKLLVDYSGIICNYLAAGFLLALLHARAYFIGDFTVKEWTRETLLLPVKLVLLPLNIILTALSVGFIATRRSLLLRLGATETPRWLMMLAGINIGLLILNILPFPGIDGFRALYNILAVYQMEDVLVAVPSWVYFGCLGAIIAQLNFTKVYLFKS